MTRKKVQLVWIVNDTARKASLKKRRASLVKKVKELSTLCGVRACIIIYSPDEAEPAVWPSREEVTEMLLQFRGMPELERSKKMMDQESYIRDRLARVQSQLKKQQRKNKEMEVNQVMDHVLHRGCAVDSLGMREAGGVAWWVDERKKDVRKRVHFCQRMPPSTVAAVFSAAPAPPALLLPPPPPMGGGGGFEMGPPAGHAGAFDGGTLGMGMPVPVVDQWVWDDWFVDIMNNNNNPNENGGGNNGGSGNLQHYEWGHNGGLPAVTLAAAMPLPPQPQPQPQQGNAGSGNAGGGVMLNEMGLPIDIFKSSWPNIFSP